MRLLNSRNEEVARSQIKVLERFYVSPNEMTEIKAQKFDVVQKPSDGSPLDDLKKGTMNIKIRYVPNAPPQQPANPVSIPQSYQIPEEEVKEEDDFNPPVSITKTVTGPSRGARSGGPLSKKKAEPKAVKFNGYDDMDANEDFQPSP